MLRPRVIPCLLVHQGGLVKTVRFGDPKYVGDPINAVRIFNEKEVDELMVLDIDATVQGREPDYDLIAKLANECRMALSYGGGITAPEQIERIVGLGVEKVSIGASAVSNPDLISAAAERVGSQTVVVVLDVRAQGLFKRPEVVTHNGTRRTKLTPEDFAARCQEVGAGEIVLNSVDRDGTRSGYDMGLIDRVRKRVSIPLTAIGGAGTFQDIEALIDRFGVMGAAAGSLFVFKGKYRAVLISYPGRELRDGLAGRGPH